MRKAHLWNIIQYFEKKNGKNKQCDLKKGACWNRGWAMEARGVLEIAD